MDEHYRKVVLKIPDCYPESGNLFFLCIFLSSFYLKESLSTKHKDLCIIILIFRNDAVREEGLITSILPPTINSNTVQKSQ